MADRTITIDVTGRVTGLVSAMETGKRAVQDFGSRTQQFIEKNGADMERVGLAAGVMGAGILAGVAVAVKAWADFDSRMAQVRTLSGATSEEMAQLSQSALRMGEAIGLSANDVADAQIELVKAGVSVKDILGGALPGALALAASGQIAVGKATEIATIALTQFKLEGKDVPHVADLLAAGADKALGGVDELGMALKQGGQVAASFGLSIDDTVGTLAAFANAGLLGSDAGTSFKTMLLALASPSKKAADTMAELGINAYNTKGEFVGITGLAGQLQDKMKGLTVEQRNAALSTIFGTDAIRSASVLYKEGAAGIQEWIKNVNDQGFAAQQAAGKMDSLSGDWKKLQATISNTLIELGAGADGFLRPVIQAVTDLVRGFRDLPDWAKSGGLALAAVSGSALLVGGALLAVVPRLAETIGAFKNLSTAAPGVAGALGTVTKAAAAAGVAFVALQLAGNAIPKKEEIGASETTAALIELAKSAGTGASALDNVSTRLDGLGQANTSVWGGIKTTGDAVKWLADEAKLGGSAVSDFFSGLVGSSSAATQLRDNFKGIGESLSGLVSSGQTEAAAQAFSKLSKVFEENGMSANDALKLMPGYEESLRSLANQAGYTNISQDELVQLASGKVPEAMAKAQAATEKAGTAQEIAAKQTDDMKKALDDMGISAQGTITDLANFASALGKAGLLNVSAREATASYHQAIRDFDETLKSVTMSAGGLSGALLANGSDLDLTTEKGLKLNAAFVKVRTEGMSKLEADAKAGVGQPELQQGLNDTYNQLIKAANGMGITGTAAVDLARKVLGVPPGISIDTWMSQAAAQQADILAGKVNSVPRDIMIRAVADIAQAQSALDALARKAQDTKVQIGQTGGSITYGGRDPGYASGGPIEGPGPKGVDSLRIMAAPGEHMLTAQDVDLMGGQDAVTAFRKSLRQGTVQKGVAPVVNVSNPGVQMPSSLVVRIGERDFTAYVQDVSAPVATAAASSAIRSANDYAGRRGSR